MLRRVIHYDFPDTKMGKLGFVDVYHVAKSALEALLSLHLSPDSRTFYPARSGKEGSEAPHAPSLIRDEKSRS